MKYSIFDRIKDSLPVGLGYDVHTCKYPFSVKLSDTEFNRTSIAIDEIKNYCDIVGYQVRHVYIVSSFCSDLQRTDGKMETDNRLVIFHNGTEYDVFCYMGCEIF